MPKSIDVLEMCKFVRGMAARDENVTEGLWDLHETFIHPEGLVGYIYSLQHLQASLNKQNKGFIYFNYPERQRFLELPQTLDKTDFTNDTTAAFLRVIIAALCSASINRTAASTPLQIVASMPCYTDMQKLTVSRRSQYLYHWRALGSVLKDYARYEQAFNEDITQLVKVRNNERLPRTMDECCIWDTDIIYQHWFADGPLIKGRKPYTPLGKALFNLE